MRKNNVFVELILLLSFDAYSCDESNDKTIKSESQNKKFSVCAEASGADKNYNIALFENKSGVYKKLSANESLFRGSEELSAEISDDGTAFLASFYPKDTYSVKVSLAAGDAYVTEACHAVTTESPAPDVETLSQVVLCRNYADKAQKFSTASEDGVFESGKLIFRLSESSRQLMISSEKAFLYSEPNESAVTKMYLVKGDAVEVLNSDGRWIFVRYITNKKKAIEKWLKVSEVF